MPETPRLSLVEENESARARVNADQAPDEADLPLVSVGEDLANARRGKGREPADVWRVLKIRPEFLVAIEDGDFEALPDRAHTIGFVRSYAAYLGLDAKEIVERWKEETAAYWNEKKPAIDLLPQLTSELPQFRPVPDPEDASAPAIDFSPRAMSELPRGGRLVAVVLLLVLAYSGYYIFGTAAGTPQQTVSPVPLRLAAEATIAPKPVAEPVQEKVEKVEEPAPAVPPEPAISAPTPVPPTDPVAVSVSSTPKIAAPLPRGQEYGIANRTARIILRIHRATHVAVEGARRHMFIDLVLKPGDTYRVPNVAGVKLNVQDAGAVELIVDGTSMGFAGEDGVVANGLPLNPRTITAGQQRG
ncbi:MAG TPA: RodZ domain-containing protein [Micropepsaceae bacterium]|nr:RodZ domain-containing protein [Micropepsaceae bacterium]